MKIHDFIERLSSGGFDSILRKLCGGDEREVLRQRIRYISSVEQFSMYYPECSDIRVFSAPGRTEICGNHTDHQCGRVLAAAVSLDAIAVVSKTDDRSVCIYSDGYGGTEISLEELDPDPDEKGTTDALLRGIAAGFAGRGAELSGFRAYVTSDVPAGSGLSSSAAFEVLIGKVIDSICCDSRLGAVETAKIGQYAENVYFGKASGLMDQLVSAVGGFTEIDFCDPDKPLITPAALDLSGAGYSLCITDTKGSHAGLSDEYSAVADEMREIASKFGCDVLRQVDEEQFYAKLPELRKTCSDRALLRASHFFSENDRVAQQAEALEAGDTEDFFRLIEESGASSAEFLQNLYSLKQPEAQGLNIGLMISRRFLNGRGPCRVHGGGFAGTIQAFVPTYLSAGYAAEMDRVFGEGSCKILSIRLIGCTEITAISG